MKKGLGIPRGLKKRKGERERPCPRCRVPVRYLKGKWMAFGRRRKGWHWINRDDTHHRCGDFMEVGVVNQDVLAAQFKDALERDSYRTERGTEP